MKVSSLILIFPVILILLGTNVFAAEITGRIIDNYGDPINEVKISLNETISSCNGECRIHRDTSDRNGEFQIIVDAKDYSTYNLLLEKTEYQSKNIFLTVTNNSVKPLGDLVLLGYGTVEGRVVDIDSGRAIEDAKISLDGKTDYSDSDGDFFLKEISAQSNIIRITHDDYETYTKIYDIKVDENDLGEIELIKSYADQDYAVSAYSPYPSLTIETGGSEKFDVIIKNVGREDATFDVYLSNINTKWRYTVLNEEETEINKIFLQSGESAKIYVKVTIPSTWEGESQDFNVNVRGGNTARISMHADTGGKKYDYGLTLSAPYLGKAVRAGEEVKYEIGLTNNGTEDIYQLNTTKIPEAWEHRITSPDGGEITQLLLGQESTTTVNFILKPPADEEPGTYLTELLIAGINGGERKTLAFPTTVRQEKRLYDLEVSSPFPKKNVVIGESIEYSITIENKGRKKDTYDLKVEGLPLGWEAKFKEGSGRSSQISTMEVNGEETKNVILQINTPSEIEIGTYNFQITAASPQINKSINASLTIQGSYELKLEIDNLYLAVDAGKTKQMEIKTLNNGLTEAHDVELDVTKPKGWEVTITPSKITTLPPRTSGRFVLSVTPSQDTGIGDYMIKVKAKSKEAETEEQNIRVTVSKENSWGFLGILMIILAAVILIVVFRKFGRR